jgi:hypothetical protein
MVNTGEIACNGYAIHCDTLRNQCETCECARMCDGGTHAGTPVRTHARAGGYEHAGGRGGNPGWSHVDIPLQTFCTNIRRCGRIDSMKRYTLPISVTVVLTAVLLVVHSRGEPQQLQLGPNGPTGKYQLVTGRFPVVITDKRGNTAGDQPGVFKIDTETGDVWMLIQLGNVEKGELVNKWMPVDKSH